MNQSLLLDFVFRRAVREERTFWFWYRGNLRVRVGALRAHARPEIPCRFQPQHPTDEVRGEKLSKVSVDTQREEGDDGHDDDAVEVFRV